MSYFIQAPAQLSAHLRALRQAKGLMAVRSKSAHYKLLEIRTEHWFGLAKRSGIAGIWGQMVEMVEGVDAALARVQTVLPKTFPPGVWGAVEQGTRDHAAKFLDGVKRVRADVKVPA